MRKSVSAEKELFRQLERLKVALQAPDGFKRLYDFFFAKVLFSIPPGIRKRIFAGDSKHCPICSSDLRKFLVIHRPHHLFCPVCRSLQRHRMVWLFIKQHDLIKSSSRILHVAPEPALAQRFRQIEGVDYLSADLQNPAAMVQMDITDIKYPDAAFSFIFCSHVLEHIPEDLRAMQELYRVLEPGGKALLMVPISGKTTFEDPSITDPKLREKFFGQLDHVRKYGWDFMERLQSTGFSVEAFDIHAVASPEEIEHYGLPEKEIIFIGTRPLNP